MSAGDSDAPLVARLIEGDKAAFDSVYDRYRARIYSFLVRLTKDRTLSEDLLQETFVRLARHSPKLLADTNLAAWLYRVARNLFISHRRWQLVDTNRLAEARLFAQLRPPPVTPFALHAASETQLRLEAALSALPLRYREVILLLLVEGLDHAQASEVLEIERATLRQRLKRGRDMLAKALQEADEQAPA